MREMTPQVQKAAESECPGDPSHQSPTEEKGFGEEGTAGKVESFQHTVPS